MKTKAVRLYGINDLRLEEFELPAIKKDEILAQVISDSVCMSSYKAAIQGPKHKGSDNVAENPVMIGHELWDYFRSRKMADQFKPGQNLLFSQP